MLLSKGKGYYLWLPELRTLPPPLKPPLLTDDGLELGRLVELDGELLRTELLLDGWLWRTEMLLFERFVLLLLLRAGAL